MNDKQPDVWDILDRAALSSAARALAQSGVYYDWREVLAAMLEDKHFGSATLFLDRDFAAEIDAACAQAVRPSVAPSSGVDLLSR